jgi:hypothetical protein
MGFCSISVMEISFIFNMFLVFELIFLKLNKFVVGGAFLIDSLGNFKYFSLVFINTWKGG